MKAKANQQSQGDSTVIASEPRAINLDNAFVLKGNMLQPQAAQQVQPPEEKKFKSAKELVELIVSGSKLLFGERTFVIPLPKKSPFAFWNDFVPTGLLLDLTDPVKPRFYILDVVLSTENLLGFLLPQLTRFLSSFRNQQVIESLGEFLCKDKEIVKALQVENPTEHLQNTIAFNHHVLLITDGAIEGLEEIRETFKDGDYRIKSMVIRKYARNGDTFCISEPPFSAIHRKEKVTKVRTPRVPVTEEEHLSNVSDPIKEAYSKIKTELLKTDRSLQFNPQKYYISLRKDKNLAFFHFSHKRISLVVMNSEKNTRKLIKHHEIRRLTEKVQKFWNGESCTIVIENAEHLNELIALLKKLITA